MHIFINYYYLLDCNLNFHKRCIVKILNDCDIGNQYNYKPCDTSLNDSILSNITDDSVRKKFIFIINFNF